MPLSENARLKYMTFTPCAIAPLSLVGSSLTMLTIYRTRRAGTTLKTYHRLLLCISIFDCILSTGLVLGPLPMPKDFPSIGAHGNVATCSFQAFLLQLGSASFVYSNMLMLYYLLVIRYGVRDKVMSTRIEPFMHVIPIGYHLGTAIAGLFLKVFNPAGSFCWVAAHPLGCDEDPEIVCLRGGEHVELFGLWLLTIPMIGWTCLLCLFILIVAFTVWWNYRKSKRFAFGGESSNNQTDIMAQRTRRTITQCFLYATSFLNVIVWSTMGTIVDLYGVNDEFYDKHFWFSGLSVFFFPIQGLFSFLIYIRPRYLTIRADHREESRWFAIKEAVWYPVSTATERASRSGTGSSWELARRRLRTAPDGAQSECHPETSESSSMSPKLETDREHMSTNPSPPPLPEPDTASSAVLVMEPV